VMRARGAVAQARVSLRAVAPPPLQHRLVLDPGRPGQRAHVCPRSEGAPGELDSPGVGQTRILVVEELLLPTAGVVVHRSSGGCRLSGLDDPNF
jgi:hypothetical protein